jgi:hypothetical protein
MSVDRQYDHTMPLTPGQRRTAAATAARSRARQEREATHLRAAGWLVIAPEDWGSTEPPTTPAETTSDVPSAPTDDCTPAGA